MNHMMTSTCPVSGQGHKIEGGTDHQRVMAGRQPWEQQARVELGPGVLPALQRAVRVSVL